jgi:polar amino acid transport system permease protein
MMRDLALIWQNADRLLDGLINTVILSLAGASLALVFGAMLAVPLMSSNRVLRLASRGLVDLMRCVPFLMLTYLIYYGLPRIGLRFDSWTAGLLALVIYNTTYMAEIIRGIWSGLGRETIEAGIAFGFHGWRLVSRIILPQVVLSAGPMIGNQLIQIIKDTAFLTIITVPELTHAANSIQAQYFIPFAMFFVAIMIYWALCMLVELGVHTVERLAERRR